MIAVFAVAAMMYGLVGDASACERSRRCDSHRSSSETLIEVDNEDTRVVNIAGSLANTGLNTQTGGRRSAETLYTGSVTNVDSMAVADVNRTLLPECLLCSTSHHRGELTIDVDNDDTHVINAAVSVGNSGLNEQMGSRRSGSYMNTGSAATVFSTSNAYVNYTDMSVE